MSRPRGLFSLHCGLPYRQRNVTELYDAAKGSGNLLQRLKLERKLEAHNGCVNTICWNDTGACILSGSDDQHLNVTDPFSGKRLYSINSAHKANIFSAKFLPGTGDKQIISCSGDGMLCYTNVEQPENYCTFDCHFGTTYEVITVPQDSHSFLSCGEDGTVRWFDLRMKQRCSREDCKEDIMINCRRAVTSLAINPDVPYELCAGCSDSSVRIFDRRMLGTRATGNYVAKGITGMISRFVPAWLEGKARRITSLQYSPDGQEVLVSYSSDHIYVFNLRDNGRSEELKKGQKSPEAGTSCVDSSPGSSRHAPIKRLRLRGDWSDTGPNARPERERTEGANEGDHTAASIMQRMSDMLTRWLEGTTRDPSAGTPEGIAEEGPPQAEPGPSSSNPLADVMEGHPGSEIRFQDLVVPTEASPTAQEGSSVIEDLSTHTAAPSAVIEPEPSSLPPDPPALPLPDFLSDTARAASPMQTDTSDPSKDSEPVPGFHPFVVPMEEESSSTPGISPEPLPMEAPGAGERSVPATDSEPDFEPPQSTEQQLEHQDQISLQSLNLASISPQPEDSNPSQESPGSAGSDDLSQESPGGAIHSLADPSRDENIAPAQTKSSVESTALPPGSGVQDPPDTSGEQSRTEMQSSLREEFVRLDPIINVQYNPQGTSSGLVTVDFPGATTMPLVAPAPQPTTAVSSESLESSVPPPPPPPQGELPTLEVQAPQEEEEATSSGVTVDDSERPRRLSQESGSTLSVEPTGSRRRRQGHSGPPTGDFQLHSASEHSSDEDDSDTELMRATQRNRASRDVARNIAARKLQELYRKRQEERENEELEMRNIHQPSVKMEYKGHRNSRTMIKEACFWGNDYVMSGSDCGHVFVWDRYTAELAMLFEADKHVVNCIQPHPCYPILATSGIDYDIKLWAPVGEESIFDPVKAAEVIRRNEVMLEETRDTITVPASFMLRMLASLNQIRSGHRAGREGTSSSSSDNEM